MTQIMTIEKSRWLVLKNLWTTKYGRTVTIFQDGTSSLKLEIEWTNIEDNEVRGNSKTLNVIFNGFKKIMFRLINTSYYYN